MPEDCKRSIIVPVYKREDANVTGNYRGISLHSAQRIKSMRR